MRYRVDLEAGGLRRSRQIGPIWVDAVAQLECREIIQREIFLDCAILISNLIDEDRPGDSDDRPQQRRQADVQNDTNQVPSGSPVGHDAITSIDGFSAHSVSLRLLEIIPAGMVSEFSKKDCRSDPQYRMREVLL